MRAWIFVFTLTINVICFHSCSQDSPTAPEDLRTIVKVVGDNQSGVPGDTLSVPLTVQVLDGVGTVVTGQRVDFNVTEGTGSCTESNDVTDSNGKASTQLILGGAEGSVRVEAKPYNSNASVVFSVSSQRLPASSITIISGNYQYGNPGEQLPDSLKVLVKNERDLPVVGVTVQFSVTQGEGGLSTSQVTTNSAGVAGITFGVGFIDEDMLIEARVVGTSIASAFNIYTKSGRTSLIAYVHNKDIYVINPDGSNLANITNDGNNYYFDPVWSTDASMVACRFVNSLYVMNRDGSNFRKVFDDLFTTQDFCWSPDGNRIAYLKSSSSYISLINIDGTNPSKIEFDYVGVLRSIDWSYNSSKMAFSTFVRTSGEYSLYTVNEDGSELNHVITSNEHIIHLDWSPDGTKIIFKSSNENNQSDIYVVDTDGRNLTNLTNDTHHDQNPSWSPDGREIIYISVRNSNFGIFRINSDGSNPIVIATIDAIYGVDWSPYFEQ